MKDFESISAFIYGYIHSANAQNLYPSVAELVKVLRRDYSIRPLQTLNVFRQLAKDRKIARLEDGWETTRKWNREWEMYGR